MFRADNGSHAYVKLLDDLSEPDAARLRDKTIKGSYLELPSGNDIRWGQLLEIRVGTRNLLKLVRTELLSHLREGIQLTLIAPGVDKKGQALVTARLHKQHEAIGFCACILVWGQGGYEAKALSGIPDKAVWSDRFLELFKRCTEQPDPRTHVILGDLLSTMQGFGNDSDLIDQGLLRLFEHFEAQPDAAQGELVLSTLSRIRPASLDRKSCQALVPTAEARLRLWMNAAIPRHAIDPVALIRADSSLIDGFSLDQMQKLLGLIAGSDGSELVLGGYMDTKTPIVLGQLPALLELTERSAVPGKHRGSILKRLTDRELTDPAFLNAWSAYLLRIVKNSTELCCFDLEVDATTQSIREAAYSHGDRLVELEAADPSALQELSTAIQAAGLIVGHNIREFDSKYVPGLTEVDLKNLWDTLEVETLLRPMAKSLALSTAHRAKQDVEHTLSLFGLQLVRILTLSELRYKIIAAHLSASVVGLLSEMRKESVPAFAATIIENAVLRHFRGSATDRKRTNSSTRTGAPRLLICPEALWEHFTHERNLAFGECETHDGLRLILEAERIEADLQNHLFLQRALQQFLLLATEQGFTPFARHLSPYLSKRIGSVLSLEQLCSISDHPSELDNDDRMVTEWQYLRDQGSLLKLLPPRSVTILGPEHWIHASGRTVMTCAHADFDAGKRSKSLWAHFANGVNSIAVDSVIFKELAKRDPIGDHRWITRTGHDTFLLQEQIRDPLTAFAGPGMHVMAIEPAMPEGTVIRVRYLRLRDQAIRFDLNPETLYRDAYWAQVIEKVEALAATSGLPRPLVLVVEHRKETGALREALQALGFKVTKEEVAVARRVELASTQRNGIALVALDEVDKLLDLGTETGCSFLLESLHPQRWAHLHEHDQQNELDSEDDPGPSDAQTDEESADDDGTTEEDNGGRRHATSMVAIRQLAPYYAHLANRLLTSHEDNQLVILDPAPGAIPSGGSCQVPCTSPRTVWNAPGKSNASAKAPSRLPRSSSWRKTSSSLSTALRRSSCTKRVMGRF
ncbi:MAG: hypothetical protein IPO12_06190 [Flavobacteriales bacterium]|nr:hypothetical protein [Flavobacteriales bacterium]